MMEGGREIARRIAMGESEDVEMDSAVLLDWVEEQEHMRRIRNGTRLGWWRAALKEYPPAAAFALSIGCEEMDAKQLRRAMHKVLSAPKRLGDRERDLAATFTRMCGAHHHADITHKLTKSGSAAIYRAMIAGVKLVYASHEKGEPMDITAPL